MTRALDDPVDKRIDTSSDSESGPESPSFFVNPETSRQPASRNGASPSAIYDFLIRDTIENGETERASSYDYSSFDAFSRGASSFGLAPPHENAYSDSRTNDSRLFQHFRDVTTCVPSLSVELAHRNESLTLDVMHQLHGERNHRDIHSSAHLNGHLIPNMSAYKLPDGLHQHLQHKLQSPVVSDPDKLTKYTSHVQSVNPAMQEAPLTFTQESGRADEISRSCSHNYLVSQPAHVSDSRSADVHEPSSSFSQSNISTRSVGPRRAPGIGQHTQTVLSTYSFKLPAGTHGGTATVGDPSNFTFPALVVMEVSPDTLYMIHHGPQSNPLAVKHANGAFMAALHQTTSYTLKLIASNDASPVAVFNELQIAVLHCTFIIQPSLRNTPGIDGVGQPTIGPSKEASTSKLSPYNASAPYHAIQFRSLISKVTYIPIPEYLFDIQSSSFTSAHGHAVDEPTFNEYYTSNNVFNSNIKIKPVLENVKNAEFSLFIGQTTYRTTPSVLYYIFNVVCKIEILEVEIMRKQPCAFFYVYLRNDADVKQSIRKLHKRILFDLHGVWFAQNDREAERLQEFVRCERDKMFPVLPLPKQCMVVEKRNNYMMTNTGVQYQPRSDECRPAHRPGIQSYYHHPAGPHGDAGHHYPPFATGPPLPRHQLGAFSGHESQYQPSPNFHGASHQMFSYPTQGGPLPNSLQPVAMHPFSNFHGGSPSLPVHDGPCFPPHPHPAEYATLSTPGQPSGRQPAVQHINSQASLAEEKKRKLSLSVNVISTFPHSDDDRPASAQ